MSRSDDPRPDNHDNNYHDIRLQAMGHFFRELIESSCKYSHGSHPQTKLQLSRRNPAGYHMFFRKQYYIIILYSLQCSAL